MGPSWPGGPAGCIEAGGSRDEFSDAGRMRVALLEQLPAAGGDDVRDAGAQGAQRVCPSGPIRSGG